MPNFKNTRRQFLTSSGITLSAGWVTLNMPILLATGAAANASLKSGDGYQNLSAEQATQLGAFADQIIPPDESPGAVETGVVYFIDGALGSFMAGSKPMVEAGLLAWNQKARAMNAGVDRFSGLSKPEQTDLLKGEEDTAVFGLLRLLVLFGMFSSPKYGGNRNEEGWKLIGFDKRHVWSPPFGYYDAQAMGSSEYVGENHA